MRLDEREKDGHETVLHEADIEQGLVGGEGDEVVVQGGGEETGRQAEDERAGVGGELRRMGRRGGRVESDLLQEEGVMGSVQPRGQELGIGAPERTQGELVCEEEPQSGETRRDELLQEGRAKVVVEKGDVSGATEGGLGQRLKAKGFEQDEETGQGLGGRVGEGQGGRRQVLEVRL